MNGPVKPLIALFCAVVVASLAGCDDDEIENIATVKLETIGKAVAPAASSLREAPAGITQPMSSAAFVGLTEQQIDTLLGPPTERMDLAPAQAWRYRGDRCVLELFLYIDVKSRVFRALRSDVVADEDSVVGRDRCLAELETHAHRAIIGVSGAADPRAR